MQHNVGDLVYHPKLKCFGYIVRIDSEETHSLYVDVERYYRVTWMDETKIGIYGYTDTQIKMYKATLEKRLQDET